MTTPTTTPIPELASPPPVQRPIRGSTPTNGVGCWVDLFDHASFKGERRRIFGPVLIDATTLGLHQGNGEISVRVGNNAGLKIKLASGKTRRVRSGATIASLDPRPVITLEIGS